MPELLTVLEDFPPVATEEWETAIAKDLKGADYQKKLVWRTEEGLAVRPYYRREALSGLEAQTHGTPGRPPFARGTGESWKIAQYAAIDADAIRADLLHEAGAHAVQELGYAIAAGVQRLAELTDSQPVDRAVGSLQFVFAAGPATFVEIAKFRAARLLWAQAVAAFGWVCEKSCRMRIHVRTPRRNKSVYDRYTNLLRVTTEAFAAAVGGCDSLDVEPFGFDAHLALNVQRILKEESHLDAVADPAGGSYYVEALTDQLAREAWRLFQQIEAEGGYAAAVRAGTIEQALAESRAARVKSYSARRRALVGVNNYPDYAENAPWCEALAAEHAFGLPQVRIAEPFEAIRQRTAEHAKATGRCPKVLLLKRGDVKMKGARATFCINFFGCAGFDIEESESYNGTDAELVVLCSSDPEYPALAREVCAAVNTPVLVAGNPKELTPELNAAGVQGYVHIMSDALQTLTEWQDRLGMRSAQ